MIETFQKCLDLDLPSSQESVCQSTTRLFKLGRRSILSSLCAAIAEGIIPFPRDKGSSVEGAPLPALPVCSKVWPGPFASSSVWITDRALIHQYSMVQNKSAPLQRKSFENPIFCSYKPQASSRCCCLSPSQRCHKTVPGAASCRALEGNYGVACPGAWADRSVQFLLCVIGGFCFPSLFVYSFHPGCVLCLVLSLFT